MMNMTPIPADQPAPQNNPLFAPAHAALVEKAKTGRIDLYFIGDSITRRWQATDSTHQHNWNKNFFGWNAANFGWGGDTTQNVLYRLLNGELDGVNPQIIILLIGSNNVGNIPRANDDAFVEDFARGIKTILDVVNQKAPGARIVLMGITPRNDLADSPTALIPAINKINARIAAFANGKTIKYIDINDKLADKHGKLFDGMTEDGVHLADKGYQVWADALKPILTDWLGPPAATDLAPPATGIPTI